MQKVTCVMTLGCISMVIGKVGGASESIGVRDAADV